MGKKNNGSSGKIEKKGPGLGGTGGEGEGEGRGRKRRRTSRIRKG